jgi:hypothetical protein
VVAANSITNGKRRLAFFAIFVAHGAAIILLFPTRQTDLVKFLAPSIAAFVFNLLADRIGWSPNERRPSLLLPAALTIISFWVGLGVALNEYGS